MTQANAQNIIETAWEQRTSLSVTSAPTEVRNAVNCIINDLDAGKLRVAEKIDGQWMTHQWIKKAVLLSFRLNDNVEIRSGELGFFDKVPTKARARHRCRRRRTGEHRRLRR